MKTSKSYIDGLRSIISKSFFLFVLIFITSTDCFGDTVSDSVAANVAKNFFFESILSNTKISTKAVPVISKITTVWDENVPSYYVFNFGENNGFVIVSAEDAVYPILGYSFTGHFTGSSPTVKNWMENYKKHIKLARTNQQLKQNVSKDWQKYETKSDLKSAVTPSNPLVGPLLATTWSQEFPYNSLCCPNDVNHPGQKPYVGCVAVSMGQVMKYFGYPTTGQGSRTYTDPQSPDINCNPGGMELTWGMQSVNFANANYNYANMPNSISTNNDAVATLLYHCGVSVEMNYGGFCTQGSSSGNGILCLALKQYFNYSASAQIVNKSNYSDAQWVQLLKSEISYSRPIVYGGSGASGGHSWVCDGFDALSNFHMNWGFGGNDDGWYYILSLTPSSIPGGFPNSNSAVIGINPPASLPPVPSNLASSNNTTEGFTISWTASTGATSYNVYFNGVKYSTASNSYTFSGLSSGTSYPVSVSAQNSIGESGKISITPMTVPLAPKYFVGIEHSPTWVTLSWTPSYGATTYYVSWGGGSSMLSTSATTTEVYGPNLNSTVYKLWAANSGGSSSKVILENINIPVAPLPPSSLTIGSVTSSGFSISWPASTSGATGYYVYLNGTKYTAASTSYTFSGLSSGTSFSVSVSAYNSVGESEKTSTSVKTPPAAPTNFTAVVHSGTWVTLSWTASFGATNYNIQFGTSMQITTGTSIEIFTSNANTLLFTLWATNSGGSSPPVILNLSPPNAPTPLTVGNISTTGFIVSWPASTSGATGYYVYLNGTKYTTSSTSYTFSGLSSGTSYSVSVSAYNNAGESLKTSTSVITLPAAPYAKAATSVTASSFTVNWDPVPGANGYVLDISKQSNFSCFVQGYNNTSTSQFTGNPNGSVVVYINITANTTYYYRLRSVNASGQSANSNTISVLTSNALPAAPVAKAATNVTAISFTVNWDPVSGANGYVLDISKQSNFSTFVPGYNNASTSQFTGNPNGSVIVYSNITVNTPYYYRLRSVNASGQSTNSNIISLLTLPSGLMVSRNDMQDYSLAINSANVRDLSLDTHNQNANNLLLNSSWGEFYLFPNPVSNLLTINSSFDFNELQASIYSIDGKLVITKMVSSDNPSLETGSLIKGIYYIGLSDGRTATILKFIKE
ncbi:MAG: C10 family peptidase [Bacteroidota bacterium]|nr:MAG: C10 family peptidase [Bacteroidota bacterium]